MKYITKAFGVSPPPKVQDIDVWLNSFVDPAGKPKNIIVGYVMVNNFIVVTICVDSSV